MASSAPASPNPTYKRRFRTYLLNPRFQLKYTGLLVATVVSVMMAFGVIIWNTSAVASRNAELAAEQAERALKESATSARLLKTSAAMYADSPELSQTLEKELADLDTQYKQNLATVAAQRAEVEVQRKQIFNLLVAGGATLVILLAALGIFITHRIVGPVFRLKRLCRQVSTSRLTIPYGLRKGDELEDLFDTFVQMTYSLKALQTGRLATLDATIEKAEEAGVSGDVMKGLYALRAQLCLGLSDSEAARPEARGGKRRGGEAA